MTDKAKDKQRLSKAKPSQAGQVKYATRAEIDKAVDELDDVAWTQLQSYALGKFRALHGLGKTAGREAQDLISEAFAKMLDGSRKWYPSEQGFFDFVRGAISSIASNWKTEVGELPIFPETVIAKDNAGTPRSPVGQAQAPIQTPEEEAISRAETSGLLKALFDAAEGDEDVEMMLELRLDGMKSKDDFIKAGMAADDYDGARKRLERIVARVWKEKVKSND